MIVKIVDKLWYSELFVDGENIARFGWFESRWCVLSHCANCVGQWLDLRDMGSPELRDRRRHAIMDQLMVQLA